MFRRRRYEKFDLHSWRMLGMVLADHFDELPESVKLYAAMAIVFDSDTDTPEHVDQWLRERPYGS